MHVIAEQLAITIYTHKTLRNIIFANFTVEDGSYKILTDQ